MNAFTLRTPAHPLFQIQPEKSHPKTSVLRVFRKKFVEWLDGASGEALTKAGFRLFALVVIAGLWFAPRESFGILQAVVEWRNYRIPLFLGTVIVAFRWKRAWLFLKRTRLKSRANNQHLYHGIPVGEFASWLLEERAFKMEPAMKKWGLSQNAYSRIAEELEEHGVLTRGEKNARVLRDISREDLVRQLRDKFPLAWSDERQMFYEINGTMERWAISQDFKRRRLDEETGKKERKKERLEEQIEEKKEELSGFAQAMALCQ